MNTVDPVRLLRLHKRIVHNMQLYEERFLFGVMHDRIGHRPNIYDTKSFELEPTPGFPDRKTVLHFGRIIGYIHSQLSLHPFHFELEFIACL